jgi:hypothetical protein
LSNLLEDAEQCSTKLHGLCGAQFDGVIVDEEERVVTNGSRATFPLRDDAERAESEVLVVKYLGRRQQDPLSSLYHIDEFAT